MARELATEKGIGESADTVWKLFRSRNSFHYSGSKTMPSEEPIRQCVSIETHIETAVQLGLFH